MSLQNFINTHSINPYITPILDIYILPRQCGKTTVISELADKKDLIVNEFSPHYNNNCMYVKLNQLLDYPDMKFSRLWLDEFFFYSEENQNKILNQYKNKNIIILTTSDRFFYKPDFMRLYSQYNESLRVYTAEDIKDIHYRSGNLLSMYNSLGEENFLREVVGKVWVK